MTNKTHAPPPTHLGKESNDPAKDSTQNRAVTQSEFLDITLSLPSASPSPQPIALMDKQGNLVQPAQVDLQAQIKSEKQGGKQTMSEAHGIDQSRNEYFRSLKLKEIQKLQASIK